MPHYCFLLSTAKSRGLIISTQRKFETIQKKQPHGGAGIKHKDRQSELSSSPRDHEFSCKQSNCRDISAWTKQAKQTNMIILQDQGLSTITGLDMAR